MFLDTPLCFARFVSFLACDAACRFSATCSKSTCSNWMTSWASFVDGLRLLQILLADGMRFLSMSSRMPSKIFWSSASTFATYSLAYGACCSFSYFHCSVQFIPLCEQPQLQTDNLLDLNLHLMFFVLRLPSLQSTWLLQRSVSVCCISCCFCVTPFRTSSVFVLLFTRRFLDSLHLVYNSAAFCFSTSISVSISTWCSLAFSATFNSCSAAVR